MWINRFMYCKPNFICNTQRIEDFTDLILSPVIKWAQANPSAEVNLWYDSATVNKQALKNTNEALRLELDKIKAKQNIEVENIQLRDIRTTLIVQDNPDIFTDQLPLYFRIDLLKLIIIVNSIENENFDAAIFSDLEVGDLRKKGDRMNKSELFDTQTLTLLNKYGASFEL